MNHSIFGRMFLVATLDLSSKKDKVMHHSNPGIDLSGPYNALDRTNATSEATRLSGAGSSGTHIHLPNRAARRPSARSSDRSRENSNTALNASDPIRYFYKVNNTVLPQWMNYIGRPSQGGRRRQVINQAATWFPSLAPSFGWVFTPEGVAIIGVLAAISTLLVNHGPGIAYVINYIKTRLFPESSDEIGEKMRLKERMTEPYAIFSVYTRLRLEIVIEAADNEACHSYYQTFTNETTLVLIPKPSYNFEDQWSIVLMPSDKSDFEDLRRQCAPCLFRPYSALKGFYKLSYFDENNVEKLLFKTKWGPENFPGLVDLKLTYSPINDFSLENLAGTLRLLIDNVLAGTWEMFTGMTSELENQIHPAVLITLTGEKKKPKKPPKKEYPIKIPFGRPNQPIPKVENPIPSAEGISEPISRSIFQKLKDWVGKNMGNRVREKLPEIIFSVGAVTLIKYCFSQVTDPLGFLIPYLVFNETLPEAADKGSDTALNQEDENLREIKDQENSKNLSKNLWDYLLPSVIANTVIIIRLTFEKVFFK